MRTIATIPISAETPAFQIGLCIKRGGLITVDTPLDEYFKVLQVGDGGNLLVRGIDNEIIPFKGVLSGSFVFVLGYEVVSDATVDGVAMTTTASNITWGGGF